MNRHEIANFILLKITEKLDSLRSFYSSTQDKIGYFYIDDLLPEHFVLKIYNSFPASNEMRLKKSLREYKYIAAQMNAYNPLLEEVVYAFQDDRVVKIISKICNIQSLTPDENLYAGGISMMSDKHYLNPHLDNSHDKDRNQWRVLNLLYYVSPNWNVENGGNLEIWPNGMNDKQITIHSKFNRLVVVATHDSSWHSVSPVSSINKNRCCVSNYYFSDYPLKEGEEFHVTAFRGRPGQKIRDLVLRTDITVRMLLRKVFPKGAVKVKHLYKK